MTTNLNELSEWWVCFLFEQTEQARAHAQRTYGRNIDKQNLFMEAFHYAMVNARVELWAKLEQIKQTDNFVH